MKLLLSSLLIVISLIHFSQAYSTQTKEKRFSIELKRSLRNTWYNTHNQYKRDTEDDSDTLRTSLIIVFSVGIIIGILLVMTICAVCMLHRARYGAFCCLKPKIRRYPQALHFESDCSEEESQPPKYDKVVTSDPPDYTDAIQDVVLEKGINTSNLTPPAYQSSVNSGTQPTSSTQELQQEDRQDNSAPSIDSGNSTRSTGSDDQRDRYTPGADSDSQEVPANEFTDTSVLLGDSAST